jgi:hypothetical protein
LVAKVFVRARPWSLASEFAAGKGDQHFACPAGATSALRVRKPLHGPTNTPWGPWVTATLLFVDDKG